MKLNQYLARLRVFAAQFKWARSIYRGAMILAWNARYLAKRVTSINSATAKYGDDALFPVSDSTLEYVSAKIIDLTYVNRRYGHLGTIYSYTEEVLEALSTKKGIDPNFLFDSAWYRVVQEESGVGLELEPLEHYLKYSRDLALSPSPVFLHDEYLRLNPDMRKSRMNLLYHFLVHGQKEGRHFSLVDQANAVRSTRPTRNFSGIRWTAVLIPVFNNWVWTQRALESVILHTEGKNVKIYVADDCSTDETVENIKRLYPHVHLLRNKVNLGFVRSCNSAFAAISATEADYIYLLNNDAEVQEGFLDEPLRLMGEDKDVAIVGSKLVYSDGRLQEAGGIIWRNATGWNFGRNGLADEIKFNMLREADYISGAALLLRVTDLREVGFFDERFAPAYYEDTDLAFALRALGKKTIYCPDSVVIHHEGKSHGTNLNQGMKKYQVDNQSKFAAKWQADLNNHFDNDPLRVNEASLRLELNRHQKTILWVDYQLPNPTKDSGSVRAVELLTIAKKLGYFIIFVPANSDTSHIDPFWIQRHGIVVSKNTSDAKKLLKSIGRTPDIMWLSRVSVCEDVYEDLVREYPSAATIFDTVDLHFLRLQRESEVSKSQAMSNLALKVKRAELGYIEKANLTLVVSDVEKDILTGQFGLERVAKVSNVHGSVNDAPKFDKDRRGIVFVGSFNHHPNESGMLWFHSNVWPLLPDHIRDEGLLVIGPNPSAQIKALDDKQIKVLGWVPSSMDYVRKARVSVAPLLVGSGVKGKIGEAFLAGTPVVTTSVGSEGMGIKNEEHALVADEAKLFADCIVKIFNDPKVAKFLSDSAADLVEREFGHGQAVESMQAAFELALSNKNSEV